MTSQKHACVGSEQLEAQYDDASLLEKPEAVPESEPKMPLWAALRRWPRVSWYSLALTSTIVLWGFDNVLVGSVSAMPVFQENYGEKVNDQWIIPKNWLAVWNLCGPVGAMSGAIIAGWLGDRIGRRWMLASATILSAASVVVFISSDTPANLEGRRGLFLLGKVISGLGIGAITTTVQTYMSETVPTQLRGSIITAFPIFQLIGQITGSIIIQVMMERPGRDSYRITFATIWAFSVIPLISSLIIPESPAWLLRKGKTDQAVKAHGKLEANKKFPGAHLASFARLQSTIARDGHQSTNPESKVGYLACFKGTNRRRTGVVVFANILPEMFGLSLMGSANYYLQCVGVDHSTSNLFMIIGISLGLVANILTFWIMSKFGRRRLILVTLVPAVLLWLSIGVVGTIQKQGQFVYWYTPVTMMIVIFTVGIGAWPASYVVASEASTLRLRAKTSGIGWFVSGGVSAGFGSGLPYVYNPDAANLRAQTAYVVAGFAAVALVISFFFVPEMKGRTALEIDRMFEMGLSAREFRHWGGVDVPLVKRSSTGYERIGSPGGEA